jgi:DnaJ family protein B protein 4
LFDIRLIYILIFYTCFDKKSERVEEILLIDIKPGWKKGTKITFRGKGNHLPGSRPTDLIFVVKETPHVLFKRDGRDLVMTQKISLLEALVGTTLNITTLDGREIMVKVTDIVTPQYEKVVSDEGMPRSKDPSRKGKLRIKFHIEYPSMLTSQQKLDVKRILRNAAYN